MREPDLRRTRHADRLHHHGSGEGRHLRQCAPERSHHRQRIAGPVGDDGVETLDGELVKVADGGREIGRRADARRAELAVYGRGDRRVRAVLAGRGLGIW